MASLIDPIAAAAPNKAVRPRLQRIAAVINAASGSVGAGAEAVVAQLVADRGYDLTVIAPEPHDIERAVRTAVDSSPDLVLILAGDGTARLAAGLCGPDGPLVAPLPGGTLNMLPHALYGNCHWREALAMTLDEGIERVVSGGRVGGYTFYVAAILGSPALWGHAREAVRAGNFQEAWRRAGYALRRAFSGEVNYALEGRAKEDVEALVLICPIVSKAVQQEVALEVAAMEVHGAREAFRLAFNGLVSDWRHDPGVTVEVCTRGRVWGRHSIPSILDGEIQRLPSRVQFEFLPRAFRALAPPMISEASL